MLWKHTYNKHQQTYRRLISRARGGFLRERERKRDCDCDCDGIAILCMYLRSEQPTFLADGRGGAKVERLKG